MIIFWCHIHVSHQILVLILLSIVKYLVVFYDFSIRNIRFLKAAGIFLLLRRNRVFYIKCFFIGYLAFLHFSINWIVYFAFGQGQYLLKLQYFFWRIIQNIFLNQILQQYFFNLSEMKLVLTDYQKIYLQLVLIQLS